MKRKVDTPDGWVVDTLLAALDQDSEVRKATYYYDEKYVVKASLRHTPSSRDTRVELVLTWGYPNYEEREFIKLCKKAKVPFPVKKIQLKFWPKKKK